MDSLLYFIILALLIVIVVEFFFLQWVIGEEKKEKKTLLDQLQAQNRALISKNAHDYVMTTSIDNVIKDEKIVEKELDEIPEESLNDDQWYKRMGIKEPEKPAN